MISFTEFELGDAGLIMTLNYHCFSHVAGILRFLVGHLSAFICLTGADTNYRSFPTQSL